MRSRIMCDEKEKQWCILYWMVVKEYYWEAKKCWAHFAAPCGIQSKQMIPFELRTSFL